MFDNLMKVGFNIQVVYFETGLRQFFNLMAKSNTIEWYLFIIKKFYNQ